jgi:hypothetical protein
MLLKIIVKHTDAVRDYSKTYWYDWRSTVKNNNKRNIDLFRQSHKNVIFRGRFSLKINLFSPWYRYKLQSWRWTTINRSLYWNRLYNVRSNTCTVLFDPTWVRTQGLPHSWRGRKPLNHWMLLYSKHQSVADAI